MTRPALFLDRDGVINEDVPYAHRRREIKFIDGIFELVAEAVRTDYAVIVVTNQAGIARGYYDEADFARLMDWMRRQFEARNGRIDGVYFCPHHPQHGIGKYKLRCPCRKPAPGMILRAAAEHDLDLGASILIGDKETDIRAGGAAGIKKLFLLAEQGGDKTAVTVKTLKQIIPDL